MNTGLDPVVAKKLDQFRRRRSRLILGRGLAVGIVTFLIAMGLVAAADYFWLMSDQTRWMLSLGAYALAAIAIWITCLTRLRSIPNQEEIATQIESTEPELRENLRSAVELAVDDPAAIHDSPVFRSMLQGQVAQQMGRIQVSQLLPFRLVARAVIAAILVIAAVGFIIGTGGDRVRQLATRAVLPGANIARVSRVNIDILEPTPKSLTVASDETVGVVVAVSGGDVSEVTIEMETPSKGVARQSMWPRTGGEFAANITIGDEAVEYRVLAGDAITQRYLIESRPRPHVTAFHKNYRFPEYAELPDETVTEAHGDIVVLEGTIADLALDINQDVKTAELRIDPLDSDEIRTIPMIQDTSADTDGAVNRWTAQVPVRGAAVYKVHLVSSETGFENVFAPKYEIRPVPDLIPKVGFIDQQEGTLLLPPNDILALQGMAEDDLPLDRLEQQISINGRDWLTVPLETSLVEDSARRVTSSWEWDLLQHRLKTGDQILTKLVATDRKGNLGESIPMQVVIAGVDFDPERHAVMETKFGLYDQLNAFADRMEQQKETALAALEPLKETPDAEADEATALSQLRELAIRQRDDAAELVTAIEEVSRQMPAGADANDLDLTGRVVARIGREYANKATYAIDVLATSTDKDRKTDLQDLRKAFEQTADDARNVAAHYQALATYNFVESLALDLDTMFRHQQHVVDRPTQTWNRLYRQQSIVINQLQDFERVIRRQRSRLTKSNHGSIQRWLEWASDLRQRLVDATESEEKLPDLQRMSKEALQHFRDRQRIESFDGDLPNRVVRAWRDLHNRAGSLYIPIEQAANDATQEEQLASKAADASDSATAEQYRAEMARYETRLNVQHARSLTQLQTRRELTQARPDADSQYASDAGLTHRAASSLMGRRSEPIEVAATPDETTPEGTARSVTAAQALKEVAPAYRTLEAGHTLQTALATLEVLLAKERWESQSFQARIDHPRQWNLIEQNWDLASQRIRESGVGDEFARTIDSIRWSQNTREASRRLSERRWRNDVKSSATSDLLALRDQTRDLVAELEPKMIEARAIIARYAPTIPQMARQAAEQIRELEEQTTAAAENAETKSEESPQSQNAEQKMAELREEQAAVNQQISDLLDALVEDANSQNLQEEEQRERARDADDSIAMVREPATMMNRALDQAEELPTGTEQAQQLAQAAEQQEKTADALDLVAEHFERLDQGMEVAESREQLRQAERDLGIARQMEDQYEPAEQLAAQSNQSPQELMQELEQELARNPLMQEALSEISRNTVEEAQDALEYAAADEETIQRANERSDAEFQQRKKELAEDIRNLGEQASRLSQRLVAEANSAASQGRNAAASQKLQEARETLNQAASDANRVNEDRTFDDLAEAAAQVQQQLAQAAEQIAEAAQETDRGKQEEIHDNEKSRENAKQSAERSRDRFFDQQRRSATNDARQAEEQRRREEKSVKDAERQVADSRKRRDDARKQAEERPDDQGRQYNLSQAENRLAEAEQRLSNERRDLDRAAERRDAAKAAEDAANRMPRPALNAQNPATELANQYAQEASRQAQQLEQQGNEVAESANFREELAPSRNQLANSTETQEAVSEDVSEVAENLARAARHEQRLNNVTAAEQLNTAAEQVGNVAQTEAQQATEQLQAATSEAEAAEEAGQTGEGRPNEAALAAQQATGQSEDAITAQAEQLAGILAPMQAEADAANSGETAAGDATGEANGDAAAGSEQPSPSQATASAADSASPQNGSEPPSGSQSQPASASPNSGQPSSQERARAQQLAQQLDELDRMQAAAASNSQQQPAGEPQAAAQELFAQATRAQQAQMAAQRSQSQQQAMQAMTDSGTQSADGVPPDPAALAEFNVSTVNRLENAKWGKLRNRSAEDVTTGRGEAVSEEYRASVEAYFRVLSERARKKK